MPTIVYQTVKGKKYAYSSESYWDKEKQAPRSKRTYLGRVDEETGEIIKAKDARASKREDAANAQIDYLNRVIESKDEEIENLQNEINSLKKELKTQLKRIEKIHLMTAAE